MIESRRLEMERLWRLRFVRVVFREVWAEGKRSWEGDRGGDMENKEVGGRRWKVDGWGLVVIGLEMVKLWPAPHLYESYSSHLSLLIRMFLNVNI